MVCFILKLPKTKYNTTTVNKKSSYYFLLLINIFSITYQISSEFQINPITQEKIITEIQTKYICKNPDFFVDFENNFSLPYSDQNLKYDNKLFKLEFNFDNLISMIDNEKLLKPLSCNYYKSDKGEISDFEYSGICYQKEILGNRNIDCQCFRGMKTEFKNLEDFYQSNNRCNFKKKKLSTALFLSLFISFGALHFYLGNFICGFLQFFTFLFNIIYSVYNLYHVSIKSLKKRRTNNYSYTDLWICFLINSFCFAWYLIDASFLVNKIYTDSNGVDLE